MDKSKKTILLVEDEALTAMLEKQQLEKIGYSVHHVTSGEEAVKSALGPDSDFDLILMDIDLGSGMDGTQAVEQILEKRDIPVVFLTSHLETEIIEKTEKITSYGYVVKQSGMVVLDASIKIAFKLFEAKVKEEAKEMSLRVSEEKLRITLNSISEAVIATDTENNIVHMNPAAQRLTGWEFDEAKGKLLTGVFRIVNDQALKKVEIPVEVNLGNGITAGLADNTMLIAKDGREYRIAYSATPITDVKGNINGMVLVFRDETEKYEKDRLLRENEEKYRNLFEKSPIGIFQTNSQGRVLHMNPRMAEIIGAATPEEAIGKIQDLSRDIYVYPERREEFLRLLREKGKVENFEFEARTFGGNRCWLVMNSAINRRFDDGSFIIDGHALDITERKRAEAAIRESEERFRSLFLNKHVVMLVINPESGTIVDANPRACRYYGWSKEEITRMNIADINTLSPEQVQEEMNRARSSKKNHFDFRHRLADGTVRDVEVYSGPISIKEHELLYSLIFDITERKQAEEEIKRQLSEKETILKEVHHRIKNNITTISSLLSLQMKSASPEVKTALTDSIVRVNSMGVLYDKLLISDRYENASVKKYLQSLIDIIYSLFPDVGNVTIETRINDFNLSSKKLFLLGLIVNELLTNIMKYAFTGRESGLVTVLLDKVDNYVSLTIQDNGIGLPDGFKISNSKGFGLMLVGMLVKQLNGTFTMETHTGTRSILKFEI